MKISKEVWLETFEIDWTKVKEGTKLIQFNNNNNGIGQDKEEERVIFLSIDKIMDVEHQHGNGFRNYSNYYDFFLDIPEHWEKYRLLKLLNKL